MCKCGSRTYKDHLQKVVLKKYPAHVYRGWY